jgi:choline kinase
MRHNGITDISIVRGYLKEAIDFPNINYYENPKFASTNMVATFFCAEAEFDDNLLISYADIIYTSKIVKKLAQSTSDISVVIDLDWHKLWQLRMEDPLKDAETLKLDKHGYILELGKKATSYDEIQGQYIGLIKLSKKILPSIQKFYKQLDRDGKYDNQNFDNMFMTSFLQLLIDANYPVKAIPIHGGWFEVDSLEDLKVYEQSNLFK